MNQYWYVNSKGRGQLYNKQTSLPILYSHPLIPKFGGIDGLGISKGWRGRVYPAGRKSPWSLKGFDRMEQPVNWTSPAGPMGLTAQETSSGCTTPADQDDFTLHGHNGVRYRQSIMTIGSRKNSRQTGRRFPNIQVSRLKNSL